jgi:rhamnose utilization protein RhaD (predicted bifunctional aldolase and dehydrogenase)
MSLSDTTKFKHVSYLWDEETAAGFDGDEVALLIYRSNLLGADLRITNYGGGNTSCKIFSKDPLTGNDTEVMWIKGSGGDLGSLKKKRAGCIIYGSLECLKKDLQGP